jgi:hypothetical protein
MDKSQELQIFFDTFTLAFHFVFVLWFGLQGWQVLSPFALTKIPKVRNQGD